MHTFKHIHLHSNQSFINCMDVGPNSQMSYRLPLLNLPSTYSDKVVEIAKVDEHCLCLKPLKRVQKDRISTVALNSVDDQYSLVIGFEPGDIQLLQEQSGYQCLQGTRNNDSVLSLALSGQVWHQLLCLHVVDSCLCCVIRGICYMLDTVVGT